jgi:large subunit ribosomal protein L22
MRLVIDLIRGKRVSDALAILHFSPKAASKVAERVLRSAVSNLQGKEEGGRLETDQMVVKEAFVDAGMTQKRISPAPMGRAFRIRKRSNHITIIVASQEEKTKAKATAKAAAAKSKAPVEKKKPAAQEAK